MEKTKEEYQRESVMYATVGIIKIIVGIIVFEKEKEVDYLLIIGAAMLLSSIYYLIRLIKVNKELASKS